MRYDWPAQYLKWNRNQVISLHREKQRHALLFLLSLLALTSCSQSVYLQAEENDAADRRLLLNSERIAEKFGNYGIEVLEQNPLRVSSLYSVEHGQRVCRTFAIVMFEPHPTEALLAPLMIS